jgi:hypothetical protein
MPDTREQEEAASACLTLTYVWAAIGGDRNGGCEIVLFVSSAVPKINSADIMLRK